MAQMPFLKTLSISSREGCLAQGEQRSMCIIFGAIKDNLNRISASWADNSARKMKLLNCGLWVTVPWLIISHLDALICKPVNASLPLIWSISAATVSAGPPKVRSSINPAISSDFSCSRSGWMDRQNKSGPNGSPWCGPSCERIGLVSYFKIDGWL